MTEPNTKPEEFTRYFINHYYTKDGIGRGTNLYGENAGPDNTEILARAKLRFTEACAKIKTGQYDREEESIVLKSQRMKPVYMKHSGWGFQGMTEVVIQQRVFNPQPA